MKITIRCDKNYGVETFYPACDQAKLFARIAGTKTLTRHALRDIAQGLSALIRAARTDKSRRDLLALAEAWNMGSNPHFII